MYNGILVLFKKIKNFDRFELWRLKLNLYGYLEKNIGIVILFWEIKNVGRLSNWVLFV